MREMRLSLPPARVLYNLNLATWQTTSKKFKSGKPVKSRYSRDQLALKSATRNKLYSSSCRFPTLVRSTESSRE